MKINYKKSFMGIFPEIMRLAISLLITIVVFKQGSAFNRYIGFFCILYSIIWGILLHTILDYEKNPRLNLIPATADTILLLFLGFIIGTFNSIALMALMNSISISSTKTNINRGLYQASFAFILYTIIGTLVFLNILPSVNVLGEVHSFSITEIIFGWLVFLLTLYSIYSAIHKTSVHNKQLQQLLSLENDKSNKLLLNILPETAAVKLKEDGFYPPQNISSASIVFTDFCNFTATTKGRDAEEILQSLDFYFKEFDRILDVYKLEKLKTIGDGYMFASGLPEENNLHEMNACLASIDILNFVKTVLETDTVVPPIKWDIRIGISSGPVVAGIIGSRKFHYDVWGETVNIAARLESAAIVSSILVSESVYEKTNSDLQFLKPSLIELKGLGAIPSYPLNTFR